MDFKGQTIVVTGGTSGIGRAILMLLFVMRCTKPATRTHTTVGSEWAFLFHEEPRIVPTTASMPLEPGMVIALEPAGFSSRIGVHVEHMIQITAGGALVLTDYDLTLNQEES